MTKGEFIFRRGDKLSVYCKSVPHAAGVYLLSTIKEEKEKLVYIGASGSMRQDGTFVKQLMKKRLQNMQGKIRRQSHFETEITKHSLDGVRVNWYVTFENQIQDLPMAVEGALLQQYFDNHKKLPEWNKKY
jgi:hypothetical protein